MLAALEKGQTLRDAAMACFLAVTLPGLSLDSRWSVRQPREGTHIGPGSRLAALEFGFFFYQVTEAEY